MPVQEAELPKGKGGPASLDHRLLFEKHTSSTATNFTWRSRLPSAERAVRMRMPGFKSATRVGLDGLRGTGA